MCLGSMLIGLGMIRFASPLHSQTTPPTVSIAPRNPSVSLGAILTFRATASGTPPFTYLWRFNDAPLEGATNSTLVLTNIALHHVGAYTVIASNVNGTATSNAATLDVDPTFTKVTTGLIATEGGDSSGCAWGDFDNDGWADLFVGNGTSRSFLYRNNRDGTFVKLTNAVPATEGRYGGSWADYDNDGWLDLFGASPGGNSLYRNRGDSTFAKITPFAGSSSANSWSGSWSDYDRDGWLDLYISNGAGNNDALLRNNRDGTFTRIAEGRIVRDGGTTIGATWQDYNRDSWPDLYAANNGGLSFLYRNLQTGTFERVTTGPVGTDSQNAIVPDWGDYDNDGWPDLAVGVFGRCLLYRNQGNGTFLKITTGPFVTDSQNSEIVLWADYDNDGFLDLFSANTSGQNETLYRNKGDGTFAKITTGSIVNDGGNSAGAAWGDYDNDGFLDLFVGNWQGSRPNFLYRNNGNSNSWLKVKCVGTASNRDGIGAKIRLKARIRGNDTWQLREISGGTGFGQTPLLGHFGLGDAATVETLRIEWPAGAVQELHDVAVNRALTVTEPAELKVRRSAGSMEVTLVGAANETYLLESSENLSQWTEQVLLTNSFRTNTFMEPISPGLPRRFFRARQ